MLEFERKICVYIFSLSIRQRQDSNDRKDPENSREKKIIFKKIYMGLPDWSTYELFLYVHVYYVCGNSYVVN